MIPFGAATAFPCRAKRAEGGSGKGGCDGCRCAGPGCAGGDGRSGPCRPLGLQAAHDRPGSLRPALGRTGRSAAQGAPAAGGLRSQVRLRDLPPAWALLATGIDDRDGLIRAVLDAGFGGMVVAGGGHVTPEPVEAQVERRLNRIQTDLEELKSWFGALPPEASPSS